MLRQTIFASNELCRERFLIKKCINERFLSVSMDIGRGMTACQLDDTKALHVLLLQYFVNINGVLLT